MTKELTFETEATRMSHQARIAEDFLHEAPRQNHTYLLADLDAGVDLANTVIFTPKGGAYIHDIAFLPDGSSSGVDDSNTSVWRFGDGTNEVVANTTYNTTLTFPADNVRTSLTVAGPLLAAAGRLEMQVTNGTTANLPACVVTLQYSDLDGYPVPGWCVVGDWDATAVVADGTKGVVSLSPAGAGDNDEIYLFNQKEVFKFEAGKKLVFEAYVDFTEANTDDANVIIGLMDAVAADALQDDGAGPKASYSGCVFFKTDGGTVWRCESSKSTTQTTTDSDVTAGGGTYQKLEIECTLISSTTASIIFKIDGQQCRDANGKNIQHDVTISSATEMQVIAGVKNGDTNAETLNVDYIGCEMLR